MDSRGNNFSIQESDDFEIEDAVLWDYKGGNTCIVIPGSVEAITVDFCNYSDLQSIDVQTGNKYLSSLDGVLFNKDMNILLAYPPSKQDKNYSVPNTVSEIDCNAFSRNQFLESVKLPGGLKTIEDGVFSECRSLKSIELPGIVEIGNEAFKGCVSLTDISFDNVDKIDIAAFEECAGLENIVLSKGVKKIWNGTFRGCSSLKSISMSGVTEIEEEAFQYCESLEKIMLPFTSKVSKNIFNDTDVHVIQVYRSERAFAESSTAYEMCKFPANTLLRVERQGYKVEGNPEAKKYKLQKMHQMKNDAEIQTIEQNEGVSELIEQVKKSVNDGKQLIEEGKQKLEEYNMMREIIHNAFEKVGIHKKSDVVNSEMENREYVKSEAAEVPNEEVLKQEGVQIPKKFIEKDWSNMFTKPKEVMIVYNNEGREAQYAQLLFQLISKLPNFEASQPITEKEYQTSFATIDNMPNGNVIFFGNGKEATYQGKAIDWRYDKFGMKYGWLGNRCVISADPDKIELKEQHAFGEYFNGSVEQFKNLDILSQTSFEKFLEFDLNEMYDEIKFEKSDDGATKVGKVVSAIVGSPVLLLAHGLKAVGEVFNHGNALFERTDLWKRQYELLICEFFLNGLENFVSNADGKVSKDKMVIVYGPKDAEYAHLLHNLIHQYSGYEIAEYTEKMFIDNAKILNSKFKIIFLGKTNAYKERSVALRNKYGAYGMQYGWVGNHCFISVESLKSNERNDFITYYSNKAKEYENKAKDYEKHKDGKLGWNIALGLQILNVPALFLFGLPGVLLEVGAKQLAGYAVDRIVDNLKNISDLTRYQHNLLLREFVFNGLSEYMGE